MGISKYKGVELYPTSKIGPWQFQEFSEKGDAILGSIIAYTPSKWLGHETSISAHF